MLELELICWIINSAPNCNVLQMNQVAMPRLKYHYTLNLATHVGPLTL